MFKIITKSLLKKKISTLFIIIQLCVINIIMYETITKFNIIENQKIEIKSILKENTENIISIKFNDLYPDDNFASKVVELDKQLNSKKNIEYCGGLIQTTIIIDELKKNYKYLEMEKDIYKGTKREKSLGATNVMFLDKSIQKLLNLDVVEGRNFSEEDFNLENGKIVPILLGNKFKGIVNIGDKLNADNLIGNEKKKTFVVIGFLRNNCYSLDDSHFIQNEKVNLDNYIVIPSYENSNNTPEIIKKACSYFIYAKDKDNIENIKLNAKMEAIKLGLNVECNTFEECYENYKKDNSEMNSIIVVTIIVLFIITIFSIMSSTIISIRKRRHELGVRIVTGASKHYIKRMYINEALLVSAIANLISIIYIINKSYEYTTHFLKLTFNIWKDVNIEMLAYTLILTLSMTIISITIALRKINLLQPKEIIGGNE